MDPTSDRESSRAFPHTHQPVQSALTSLYSVLPTVSLSGILALRQSICSSLFDDECCSYVYECVCMYCMVGGETVSIAGRRLGRSPAAILFEPRFCPSWTRELSRHSRLPRFQTTNGPARGWCACRNASCTFWKRKCPS